MDLFTNFATYRDLMDAIAAMPDELKDTVAYVWMPHDVSWDALPSEFIPVVALSPYDGSKPMTPENFPSFTLYEWR